MTDKFNLFIEEYKLICHKYGIFLRPEEYDALCAYDMVDDRDIEEMELIVDRTKKGIEG